MGLVSSDGFDMYNGTGANTGLAVKWAFTPGAIGPSSPSLVAGRLGGQALSWNTTSVQSSRVVRNLTSSRSATGTNISVLIPSVILCDSSPSLIFLQSGTPQFGIGFTTTGQVIVKRVTSLGNFPVGTTLGTSAASVMLNNSWQSLEILATVSSTVGAVDIYVDGVSVISLTGVNNQNAGSANCDQFGIWSNGSGTSVMSWDDYVELDSAVRLGPTRVETLRATADIAVSWTPNTGAGNYSKVNETLVDGDTTYVGAALATTSDLYSYGALSTTPANIYGVQAVDFAEKLDVNPHTLYQQIKVGATLSLGTAVGLALGYNRFDRMLTVDPNTGIAWTASAVNSVYHGPNLAT